MKTNETIVTLLERWNLQLAAAKADRFPSAQTKLLINNLEQAIEKYTRVQEEIK